MPIPGYVPSNTEDYGGSFAAIKDGQHPAMITECTMKDTKAGGKMLSLTIEVIDGESKGRKVWDNLNVVNANETAQNIAHSKLKGYFTAVGKPEATEEGELLRVPIGIKTKTKTNKEGYENTDIYILDEVPDVGTTASTDEDEIPF